MNQILNLLKYARWLSLDIVLGGVIFLFFVAQQFNVPVPVEVVVALGLAIWWIYTIDHQRDAGSADGPLQGRRRFHQANRKLILGLLIGATLVSVPWLILLPIALIKYGLILAGLCGVYLALAPWLSGVYSKEMVVGVFFGIGVCLYPISVLEAFGSFEMFIMVAIIISVVINVILIAYYDMEDDRSNGFRSMPLMLGKSKSRGLLHILIFVLLLLAISIWIQFPENWRGAVTFLLIAGLYLLILVFPSFFSRHDRFRFCTDASFYVPLIFLW